MMRIVLAALCAAILCAAPSYAVSPYFEDFETGSDGWTNWPGSPQLNLDTSHNHTPGYQSSPGNPPELPEGHAYRAEGLQPGNYTSYTQIADGTGKLRVDVWVYTDNENGVSGDDAIGMMQLSEGASTSVDYIQFGWFGGYAGGPNELSVRTRYRDTIAVTGVLDTDVPRPQINGWVKLSIEADAGVGGDLRFYMDNSLVYTGVGQRLGANLNTIRLGMNFGNNSQTTWYDDVRVRVPEPASLALLGLGSLAMVGMARRRRG